jgi:hypothetical protein
VQFFALPQCSFFVSQLFECENRSLSCSLTIVSVDHLQTVCRISADLTPCLCARERWLQKPGLPIEEGRPKYIFELSSPSAYR